ncbi:phytochelatin synthase family protein [Planctomicrobium sp. SH664]|uniref:phytochelatin synthase family protein n=1 Tax=Planctomicrobium sp. SH664 TaxID=3448125 RepID=UPI003F5C240B
MMRPKYGSKVVRLTQSREHLQTQAAPDFWALIPYYVAQPDDHSCTITTVAMALNALRVHQSLSGATELATPANVLAAIPSAELRDKASPTGPGLDLADVAGIFPPLSRHFKTDPIEVQIIRYEGPADTALNELREHLRRNEAGDSDILLANFLQSALTEDPEGAVGHMAPLGAFDEKNDRVLILDPDRRWYEPYWVPTDVLLQGLQSIDPETGKMRGLLEVRRLSAQRPAH